MSISYHIVIPARMASQRLPGKPLLHIAGKPMIQHVYERAMQASATSVVIATDEKRIEEACNSFGAEVVMTSDSHQSGSDRIAECARILSWQQDACIVNLQGDEPLMPARCLDQVANLLNSDLDAQMASLYWPLDNVGQIEDPNVVKVVTTQDGAAIMFSRSVLPYYREWGSIEKALAQGVRWKRHIGLYAYRNAALQAFSQQHATPLECAEKLEQLRVLETGGRIAMAQACEFIPAGVDTQEDLQRVKHLVV